MSCSENFLQMKISDICNNQYIYFLNKKNVVGIGCGYKVKSAFRTNQLCIQVFVSKKITKNQLSSNDIIPSVFKGFLTDVIESGIFTPCSLTQKIRPVKGGYSISKNMEQNLYGTAGCLVTNKVLNFVLSSNHVLANLNAASIGSDITEPAYIYGGVPSKDTIAKLYRFVPLRFIEGENRPINLSDCALAILIEPNILKSEIAFIGKLNCVKSPSLNSNVQKVGATTELTTGIITSISATFILNYPNGSRCLFSDQIFTTPMSEKGDSGAILVNKNKCAIGMLVSRSHDVSTFSRLDTILDQLDVQLATS